MKLILKRNQADQKGIFGGHKGVNFSLSARAALDEEEQGLIERYKLADYVLGAEYTNAKGEKTLIRVSDLTKGISDTASSITRLLQLESHMKEACQHLKTLLNVMSTFGGEQVIEF